MMSARSIVYAILSLIALSIALPLYVFPRTLPLIGLHYNVSDIYFNHTTLGRIPLILPLTPSSIVASGMVLSGVSAAIYFLAADRYRHQVKLRQQILDLIPMVSAYARSAVPLVEALSRSLSLIEKPLRTYLERFVRLVMLGEDPGRAVEAVFRGVGSEVRVVLSSIVVAMTSGGRVAEVLEEAEHFVQQIARMDFLRESRLAEYKFIALLAVVAFAFTGIVIALLVASIPSTRILGSYTINPDILRSCYYLATLVILAASSIIVSRIMSNSFVLAPRYVALLTPPISFIYAYYRLILKYVLHHSS